MNTPALYTATAVAHGDGRNGHIQSSDGLLDAPVRTPKELGGAGGATNPEQLFAAGYAACFHSALKLVASQEKLDASDSEVVADVSLHALPGGGYGLSARLEVALPALENDDAQRLIERAHQVCPYSNATRGNIDVQLAVA
ncbi:MULTISPECIES: organic hydroperoxide resistance protein [Arthrobacter]|uniref:Organic hydroperoxide resistance protein n=2 Tax=Arthrobacter TaxID=1663 RepID=A0ABU9KKT7_9MICC|nr:organic hydroperoxide resistance protein [Arthrobacter sp. YJM1]MDP5227037.1 organic hydroperoxide resistance protein [Arthrobacter sp. YJM1]